MARRDDSDVAVLNRPVGDVVGDDSDDSTVETVTSQNGTGRRAKRNSDELADTEVISLNVRVPNGLRKQVAIDAQERNTSVPQLIAEMLANTYAYELPKPTRAPRIKKYDSKEERLAAQKMEQRRKRDVTKAILAAIESGKIDLDVDALVSDMQAEANAAS